MPANVPTPSRLDIFRSKAIGCEWAAEIAQQPETRDLLRRLAAQWRRMAEQLALIDAISPAAGGATQAGAPPGSTPPDARAR